MQGGVGREVGAAVAFRRRVVGGRSAGVATKADAGRETIVTGGTAPRGARRAEKRGGGDDEAVGDRRGTRGDWRARGWG